MTCNDFDQAADLTIWPRSTPARTARSRPYATVREALKAAAAALDEGNVQTWIVTERGDILSPRWIEANLRAGDPARGTARA
ncbi:hypothetical protein [Methylobacterium symbioticum]|jgi:hypothetical protein|uniref:Uncharacterized protein n=1 Tax=Methylobacterium symbioticum TaxID=2584084 RepID=A0A509EKK6_9HYPH|nr:hypothetical protein [Methylobacterium symbioticum]VUD73763.1 hypothetical protein MET9862_04383 [Methylobacterium symbioticum]